MNKVATNIDQMPAGREMDSLVAERVMRIAVFSKQYSPSIQIPCPDNKPGCMVAHFKPVPHYSTDIADAWEVVEKITSKQCGDADDFYVFEIIKRYQQWSVYIHHPLWNGRYNELSPIYEMHEAVADTAPLAICRAALRRIG